MINKDLVVSSLEELASKELQNNRWLYRSGGEQSSFSEVITLLFNTSRLEDAIDKGVISDELGEPAADGLLRLRKLIGKVDENQEEGALIEHPLLDEIRALSSEILVVIQSVR